MVVVKMVLADTIRRKSLKARSLPISQLLEWHIQCTIKCSWIWRKILKILPGKNL